jgi:hypothetical protein
MSPVPPYAFYHMSACRSTGAGYPLPATTTPNSKEMQLKLELVGFYYSLWNTTMERPSESLTSRDRGHKDPLQCFLGYLQVNEPVHRFLRRRDSLVLARIVPILYANIIYSAACSDMLYAGQDLFGSLESFFWVLETDRLTLKLREHSKVELLGRLLSVYAKLDLNVQEALLDALLDILSGAIRVGGSETASVLHPQLLENIVLGSKSLDMGRASTNSGAFSFEITCLFSKLWEPTKSILQCCSLVFSPTRKSLYPSLR